MNKKRKAILTAIVIVIIISTIVIGFTLYKKSLQHAEVKRDFDKWSCDDFLLATIDIDAEFAYLLDQKSKDCLEMQNGAMDIETVYVKILKGAVIEGHQMLDPKVITVQIGVNNTITWINEDDTPHSITRNNIGVEVWGSPGVLKSGESYTHTFENVGIFPYHGEPHPWMAGLVIVLDSDPPQKNNKPNDDVDLITDTNTENCICLDGTIYFLNGTKKVDDCMCKHKQDNNDEKTRKEACYDYYKTNIWNDTTKTCDLRNLPDEIRRLN